MVHLHEVRDTDRHYVIDPITMVISNPNEAKNKLMLGDHNSEIYTFEIPRFVEGHDMSLCNMVEVHYINVSSDRANKSEDVYPVVDMAVAENDADVLAFSWKVSGNATMYAGSLNYRIKFACTDENGNYTYRKWTDIYTGITVGDGFDNGEAAAEEIPSDILAQWEAKYNETEKEIAATLADFENRVKKDVAFFIVAGADQTPYLNGTDYSTLLKEWKDSKVIVAYRYKHDESGNQVACRYYCCVGTAKRNSLDCLVFHYSAEREYESIYVASDNSVTLVSGVGVDGAVLYTEQTLTDEQKAQARENIGVEENKEQAKILEGRTPTGRDSGDYIGQLCVCVMDGQNEPKAELYIYKGMYAYDDTSAPVHCWEKVGGAATTAILSQVYLPAAAWAGSNSLYSQDVTIYGVTPYSKVDLLPSVEQLAIFHDKDVAFVTENEDGVVTVYAIGDKPTQDYTMQVQITEVLA